ncbi:MAG: hypothetical protein JWR90_152 [Marmoricola sp.]|jgi:hypothetical protein|nr:hypothetical protein [Marmoricola sp.]
MTPETFPVLLGESQRTRLTDIADLLIPGGEGLPSASEVNTLGQPLDRVLAADPGLLTTLVEVEARPGSPDEVVSHLRLHDPEAYERLVFAVSSAYFMVPRVRKALGYPGSAPRRSPAADDESDFYLEGDVLQPVISRGAIYRAAP